MMNDRALVLLSGGLDSSTLIHYLLKDGLVVEALFFDINQSAVQYEREAVHTVCKSLDIPLHEVSLVDWRKKLPRQVEMIVVPRNLIFALLAVPYARVLSCDQIVLGSTQDDESVRDSNQDAVASFNNMLATVGQPMRLVAPWLNMSWGKVEIMRWAIENLGKPFVDATRSCYSGGEPCNVCPACENRAQALAQVSRDQEEQHTTQGLIKRSRKPWRK